MSGTQSGDPLLRVFSWDRVRSLDGSSAVLFTAHAELAEAAFRARARLERGDTLLAPEPAERAWTNFAPLEGPTGALVAECVLRVRLSRGATIGAIWPWLESVRIRDEASAASAASVEATKTARVMPLGAWQGGRTSLPTVLDERSLLCPQVPPMFPVHPPAPAVRAAAVSAAWEKAGAVPGRAGLLAAWYRAALQADAGLVPRLPEVAANNPAATDPAVVMVSELVLSRAGTAEQRREARAALERRVQAAMRDSVTDTDDARTEPLAARWVEAWCRAALGRSLVRETTSDEQRLGIVHLLHVPARFGGEFPQLSRCCLSDAIAALRAQGSTAAVETLEKELNALDDDWPLEE